MEKTYKILKVVLLALCFVAVLLGAKYLYDALGSQVETETLATVAPQTEPQQETQGTEESRQESPDFTVYDAEGNAHKLSDFRGKPVILNFWASWCGPCKMEMPDFEEKYQAYGDTVHFVMVNMTDGAQETVESASAFLAEQGYTFPAYYDTDMDAAICFGVNAIPVTYCFDAEGNLVAWHQGAVTAEGLQKGIDMITKQ